MHLLFPHRRLKFFQHKRNCPKTFVRSVLFQFRLKSFNIHFRILHVRCLRIKIVHRQLILFGISSQCFQPFGCHRKKDRNIHCAQTFRSLTFFFAMCFSSFFNRFSFGLKQNKLQNTDYRFRICSLSIQILIRL